MAVWSEQQFKTHLYLQFCNLPLAVNLKVKLESANFGELDDLHNMFEKAGYKVEI